MTDIKLDYIEMEEIREAIDAAGNTHRVIFVDRHVGAGKTEALIASLRSDERYFIVLTFADEIERVEKAAKARGIHFHVPQSERHLTKWELVGEEDVIEEYSTSKLHDLRKQVKAGKNILTTHNLFGKVDINEVDLSEYKLIIDEAFDCVRHIRNFRMDVFKANYLDTKRAYLDGHFNVIPNDVWHENWWAWDQESVMKGLYYAAASGRLALTGDGTGYAVSVVPRKTWYENKGCVVLTYLSQGSLMMAYLKKQDISYCVKFKDYNDEMFRARSRELLYDRVHFIPMKRSAKKAPGKKGGRSAKPWSYNQQKALVTGRSANPQEVVRTADEIRYWMGKKLPEDQRPADKRDILYTCAKVLNDTTLAWNRRVGGKIKTTQTSFPAKAGLGQASWIAKNTRATNKYDHCTLVVHLADLSLDPALKSYLGMTDNQEQLWKIGEIVQLVWRSAIRVGKPVTVGFASEEMHDLFMSWLHYTEIAEMMAA